MTFQQESSVPRTVGPSVRSLGRRREGERGRSSHRRNTAIAERLRQRLRQQSQCQIQRERGDLFEYLDLGLICRLFSAQPLLCPGHRRACSDRLPAYETASHPARRPTAMYAFYMEASRPLV